MLNVREIVSKVSITKDLVADQTYTHLHKKLNTTNAAFDEVEGLGDASSTSTAVLGGAGGFDNQRVTADLKWVSPTTAGNEEIGVMVRCLSMDSPDANYYYARVDGGVAKITKVVNGTFTTLSQSAWSLAINTTCTITFSVVGDQLTAIFTSSSGTPSELTLTATDTDIPSGGLMGFRSMSSAVWCSRLVMEQL